MARATGAGFTFRNLRTPSGADPAFQFVTASKSVTASSADAWALEAVSGKIVFLQHWRLFPEGQKPDPDVLWKELIEKYGSPGNTQRNTVSGDASGEYLFDENGRQMPWPDIRKQVCAISISRNTIVIDGQGTPLGFPERMWPGCHQMVAFNLVQEPKGFVWRLDVTEINEDPIVAENKRWADIRNGQAQRQSEDAKKVKTPL